MDRRVRQYKSSHTHIPTGLAIFGEDNFVEMCGNGYIRRVPDDFVRDAPFTVRWIFARKVKRAGGDADGGVIVC